MIFNLLTFKTRHNYHGTFYHRTLNLQVPSLKFTSIRIRHRLGLCLMAYSIFILKYRFFPCGLHDIISRITFPNDDVQVTRHANSPILPIHGYVAFACAFIYLTTLYCSPAIICFVRRSEQPAPFAVVSRRMRVFF